MRRRILALPAVVIAAAAVTASTGLLGRRDAGSPSDTLTGPPATATVERRTLTRTTTVGGTLGYGDTAAVLAPGGRGMVTWLPRAGDVLERGDTVYRVDQQRVPLLYGSVPLYRALSTGSKGADVRQLESNLGALGYTGFTADDKFTAATAYAVKRWQKDLGRSRTGVVGPGDAVVSSGARRVAQLTAEPGAAASGALLRWTGTARVVAVALDIGSADLVRRGADATIELPDGTKAAARVTAIGTPAATLPIQLTVTDQRKLGRYEVARVSVDLAAETRAGVLAVPITALVAQPGGGYAVVAGAGHLPVRTGLFSDSYVEISGAGVVEGLAVGVPR
ncbi:peptidoglycan-binding domain-containing protein [Actinoplanes sp. CA-142083]|uniref:peptidoglycan-binding domain-containing protein n=1 Tax=Actinoplanes sp. CA-142083 TaxID=3239903 RepID=UPI003D900505